MNRTHRHLVLLTLVCCCGMIPGSALAQQGPVWFFSPTLGQVKLNITYDGAFVPDRPVSGQDAEMGFSQHRVRVLAPITQNDRFEWVALGGVKLMAVDTSAILPDSREEFPDRLWDLDFGTAARWKLNNGWIIGGDLIIGSASDRPFNGLKEMSIQADALLRIPWRDHLAWIFLLNYSNIREFAPHFPVPGVTLAYEPGPHLQVLAGVPFSSIRWVPLNRLELTASYFFVRTVRARIDYRVLDPLRLYASFEWDSQRYFRHDRDDDDARLSYYEKRIGGGIRWDILPSVYLDAGGGYAFDRFWFEGENYGDRNTNRIDLASGPYATLRLGLRF